MKQKCLNCKNAVKPSIPMQEPCNSCLDDYEKTKVLTKWKSDDVCQKCAWLSGKNKVWFSPCRSCDNSFSSFKLSNLFMGV